MKGRDELIHEVESLNLNKHLSIVDFTKEELMDCLAEHYREHTTGRPPLLKQLPVMLARNVKDLKEGELDMILGVGKGLWIAEEKLDGVRAKLFLGPFGNRVDSRHRSDVTYEYVEKTKSLPHLRDLKHSMPGTVLDGELIMPVERMKEGKTVTDSYLTSTTATVNSKPERAIELQKKVGWCCYYAFDVLFHCGKDVRDVPYERRYTIVQTVVSHLIRCGANATSCYITLPIHWTEGFKNFYHQAIGSGGEGVMLKRLDWPYESSKRSKGMYKWKKQKDMDCFITGFTPGEGEFSGLVGALCVSVLDENSMAYEVAAVQPGSLGFRRNISMPDGSLDDKMYGKVVEVSYLCKTKNERLRHAVLKHFRLDKTMYDCKEARDA